MLNVLVCISGSRALLVELFPLVLLLCLPLPDCLAKGLDDDKQQQDRPQQGLGPDRGHIDAEDTCRQPVPSVSRCEQ